MTTVYVGDPHQGIFSRHGTDTLCGVNSRGRLALQTLVGAVVVATEAEAEYMVILGDLLDTMNPPIQLLDAVRRVLEAAPCRVVILKGNHECASDASRDNAIHVLEGGNIQVVDTPTVLETCDTQLVLLPYRSGRIVKWLPEQLEELLGGRGEPLVSRTLCIHAGIKTTDTAPWLQDSSGAIRADTLREHMTRYGIADCFAGDWHEHKIIEGGLHQVGALCPVGYQNLGIEEYGQVAVRESDVDVRYVTVPGPRFLKYAAHQSPETLRDAPEDNTYFVEWTVKPEDLKTSGAALRALIASGVIADGSVVADTTLSKESFATAADEAKNTPHIAESVQAFVSELLVDGVDMKSVLARTLKYLGV